MSDTKDPLWRRQMERDNNSAAHVAKTTLRPPYNLPQDALRDLAASVDLGAYQMNHLSPADFCKWLAGEIGTLRVERDRHFSHIEALVSGELYQEMVDYIARLQRAISELREYGPEVDAVLEAHGIDVDDCGISRWRKDVQTDHNESIRAGMKLDRQDP